MTTVQNEGHTTSSMIKNGNQHSTSGTATGDSASSRIQAVCPALLDLLPTKLVNVLDTATACCDDGTALQAFSNSNGLDDDDEEDDTIGFYWHVVHLMFMFRVLVARTKTELAAAVLQRHSTDKRAVEEIPYANVTPAQLSERLHLFQSLLQQIQQRLKKLEANSSSSDTTNKENGDNGGESSNDSTPSIDNNNKSASGSATLFAQFTQAYHLNAVSKRVIQFLVTTRIQPSPSVLELVLPLPANHYSGSAETKCLPSSGGDETMAHTSPTIRYACGATTLHWSALANEDHELCKDRVLIWQNDEYGGDSKLSVSEEACRALLGWKLKSEDKLKLSDTKLVKLVEEQQQQQLLLQQQQQKESILDDDDGVDVMSDLAAAKEATIERKASAGKLDKHESKTTLSHDTTTETKDKNYEDTVADILKKVSIRDAKPETSGETRDGELVKTDEDEDALLVMAMNEVEDKVDIETKSEDTEDDPTKPQAYESELDYLHQFFEIAMHKVIYSRQRVAQDLRNASLSDNKPPWMRTSVESTSKQRSVGEISAKLRLARRKMDISLELTRKEGTFYPRLELLAEQLGLDDFQKFVLVYLAGSMISPIFKSCVNGDDYRQSTSPTVGAILVAYFDSFPQQVAGRTYFYKSSTLLQKGLIKNVNNFSSPVDLTDQEIQLDRRVLDCIVGLDKESSEISHGSHLYEPKVSLDSVVLPDKLKETITNAVTHFEQFRTYRKHNPDFDDAIQYGVGLTLFCGKSGTGKTLTANAIAAKLGKKLLLVNFPLLHQQSSRDSGNESSKYQSIFREAELSDAIIFFDECESLFSKRSSGGSADTTELLTELERFEGIVFLATNRPFDLDEAMYRRISEVFEFKPPNYLERLEIWKLVTSHKAVPCDPNIDWEAIALKYELTGGFIKNSVISSLLDAVGRDARSPKIKQDDILNGCKKQVRGALQMLDFNERVLPRGGLSDLVVSEPVMERLRDIVSLEKARGILFGSWGFDDDMRARQGTTALFWGPSGTGRSRSAEAIGYELGKPLKVVDLPRLLSEKKGQHDSNGEGGAKAARSVFQEARLMDAVLVLDGFSLQTEGNGSGGTGDDARVLNVVIREMTRFPGVCIMMVDTTGSLDVFVSRIDKSLLSGLKFLVEFQLPSFSNRKLLWEECMPPTLPVSETIDYAKLSEASHDFSASHIGNAIYRAAATAALRTDANNRSVSMKDLFKAIADEKTRGESAVDRWVKAQYI